MAQRRQFSSHAAAIHLIGEKLLQKIADIDALRRQQQPLTLFQKFCELAYVGGVGPDGKRSEAFLDSQVVEKAGEQARIGFRGHEGEINTIALSDVEGSNEEDASCAIRNPSQRRSYVWPAPRNRSTAYSAPSGVSSCLK